MAPVASISEEKEEEKEEEEERALGPRPRGGSPASWSEGAEGEEAEGSRPRRRWLEKLLRLLLRTARPPRRPPRPPSPRPTPPARPAPPGGPAARASGFRPPPPTPRGSPRSRPRRWRATPCGRRCSAGEFCCRPGALLMLRVARPEGQRRWTLEKEKERQAGRGRKRRLRFFFPDAGQCFFCFLSLWLSSRTQSPLLRARSSRRSLPFLFLRRGTSDIVSTPPAQVASGQVEKAQGRGTKRRNDFHSWQSKIGRSLPSLSSTPPSPASPSPSLRSR